MQWCDSAPLPFRNSCYGGVGWQAARWHFDTPKWIESFCMKSGADKSVPCINGMISWYIDYYGSLTQAEKVCAQLPLPNEKICKSVITQNASMF
jgi:hypothetical protein